MVSLCTILHGHGIVAKIIASKDFAMDFDKGTMASNTGQGQNVFKKKILRHVIGAKQDEARETML